MNIDDVHIGMTVRVGPYPSTDEDPFYDRDDDDAARYVNPAVADKTGVVTAAPGQYGPNTVQVKFTWSPEEVAEFESTHGCPSHQTIHVAHLGVYTAEADPATRDLFDQITADPIFDDLRSRGDELDTAKVKDDEDGTPLGLAPDTVILDVPTREEPVPGEYSLYPIQDGDLSGYTDQDGDELGVFFREQNCATHGYEAAFTIHVNGEAVMLSPATALQLTQYFAERLQRIRDRGEDIA